MDIRARRAAIGALLGAVLLVLVDLAAFHVGPVERLDASILSAFDGLRAHPHVGGLAQFVAGLCNPVPYLPLCALPVTIALVRRRRDVAATVIVVLLGANLTTEWLKPTLGQTRDGALVHGLAPAPGSWPSGHATAAMALALCIVLAAAPRWRPWAAAAGGVFTLAVTYAFLTLDWHYPSDAVGGFLVATTWTLIGISLLSAWRARRGVTAVDRGRRELPVAQLALLVAALGAAAAVVVLVRLSGGISFAGAHVHLLAGVIALAALAGALSGGVLLVLRRSGRT
jgi:membrane-associated phospholipid phosphatase